MAKDNDFAKSLMKVRKLLEYQLNDYIFVSSLEMDDLLDAIADQTEHEEEIQLNTAIEFERHTLMLTKIKCGRVEWQCQEALRRDLTAEYGYYVDQLRRFDSESRRCFDWFDDENVIFEQSYSYYTVRSGDMAIACSDLRADLHEVRSTVDVWKAAVSQVRIINAESQNYLVKRLLILHGFTSILIVFNADKWSKTFNFFQNINIFKIVKENN